jgi:hypothetical protein
MLFGKVRGTLWAELLDEPEALLADPLRGRG